MDQSEKSRPNLARRRIIASLGIVVFLFVYIVAVSDIGRHIPPHNTLLTLLYYALAGTVWGVPILPLISWSEAYRKPRR
jgi:hypothetical protein